MIYCENCGKKITGRGKSNKCMSCVKKDCIPWNKIIENKISCKKCKITKPINDFPKTINGHRRICKVCYNIFLKENWIKKDGYKKTKKDYRIKNKEEINSKANIYYKNNRDKRNFYIKKRRENDISFRIKENIKSRILFMIKKYNIKKNISISKMINITITDIVANIENQFNENMNWKNHGKTWHIDHIIPVNNYNFSNNKDINKCWNSRNLRPLYIKENLSRKNSIDHKLVKKYKIEDLLPMGVENV